MKKITKKEQEIDDRILKAEVKGLLNSLTKQKSFKKKSNKTLSYNEEKIENLKRELKKISEERFNAIMEQHHLLERLNRANNYIKQNNIILFSKKQF